MSTSLPVTYPAPILALCSRVSTGPSPLVSHEVTCDQPSEADLDIVCAAARSASTIVGIDTLISAVLGRPATRIEKDVAREAYRTRPR